MRKQQMVSKTATKKIIEGVFRHHIDFLKKMKCHKEIINFSIKSKNSTIEMLNKLELS